MYNCTYTGILHISLQGEPWTTLVAMRRRRWPTGQPRPSSPGPGQGRSLSPGNVPEYLLGTSPASGILLLLPKGKAGGEAFRQVPVPWVQNILSSPAFGIFLLVLFFLEYADWSFFFSNTLLPQSQVGGRSSSLGMESSRIWEYYSISYVMSRVPTEARQLFLRTGMSWSESRIILFCHSPD